MSAFASHLLAALAGALISGCILWAASRKRIREAEADALNFAFAHQVSLTLTPEESARRGGI